ncbi:GTP-binding protein [Pseudoscourfieldia marina]
MVLHNNTSFPLARGFHGGFRKGGTSCFALATTTSLPTKHSCISAKSSFSYLSLPRSNIGGRLSPCRATSSSTSPSKNNSSSKKNSSSPPKEKCPGCGVFLQSDNPNAPGFYVVPKLLRDNEDDDDDDGDSFSAFLEEEEGDDTTGPSSSSSSKVPSLDDPSSLIPGSQEEGWVTVNLDAGIGIAGEDVPPPEENEALSEEERAEALRAAMNASADLEDDFDWLEEGDDDGDELLQLLENSENLDALERQLTSMVEPSARPRDSSSRSRKEMLQKFDVQPTVVCARCYSLVHHRTVKNADAESILPSFDVAKEIVRRMIHMPERRPCVLVVLDATDIDGSLPRKCLRDIYRMWSSNYAVDGGGGDNSEVYRRYPPTLAVAVHKWDLMPTALTSGRMLDFVRSRLEDAGVPVKPSIIKLTSAYTMEGVDSLLASIDEKVGKGPSQLWVVGMQNAGKSSLLNACKSRRFKRKQFAAHKDASLAQQRKQPEAKERHPRPEEVALAAALERENNADGMVEFVDGDFYDGEEETSAEVDSAAARMTGRELAQIDAVAKMMQSPMAGGLTASYVAGTTLGAIPAHGVLPRQTWRVFDTPGVEAEGSPSRYLMPDEYRLLQTTNRLRPRSWLLKEGACLTLGGGLCMVHVKRLPENVSKDGSLRDAHVVLTLWAVRPLACHVGKFDETYSEFRERHLGTPNMSPPVLARDDNPRPSDANDGNANKKKRAKAHANVPQLASQIPRSQRLAQLPDFVSRGTVKLFEGEGGSRSRVDFYDRENLAASHDLSVFGVGWISVARASYGDGDVELDVYGYEGQGFSWRPMSLMPGISPVYEQAGFTMSQGTIEKTRLGTKVKGGVYVGKQNRRKSRKERYKTSGSSKKGGGNTRGRRHDYDDRDDY